MGIMRFWLVVYGLVALTLISRGAYLSYYEVNEYSVCFLIVGFVLLAFNLASLGEYRSDKYYILGRS